MPLAKSQWHLYRFRAFFARKFTNDSIDANHCFPLTGGIRTPFFRRLAYSEPCGALFEAVIFKKGAIFLSIEYTKFEASICWSRRAIELAPFLFSDKFKKGTECQEVVNEPRTVFFRSFAPLSTVRDSLRSRNRMNCFLWSGMVSPFAGSHRTEAFATGRRM